MPAGLTVLADVGCIVTAGASGMGYTLLLGGDQTDSIPSVSLSDIGTLTSAQDSINKRLLTDTSGQITYRCSVGGDGSVRINTLGWEVIR